MKLQIDTKVDSEKEIRAAIQVLSSFLGENYDDYRPVRRQSRQTRQHNDLFGNAEPETSSYSSDYSRSSPSSGGGLFSMFDSSSSTSTSSSYESDSYTGSAYDEPVTDEESEEDSRIELIKY